MDKDIPPILRIRPVIVDTKHAAAIHMPWILDDSTDTFLALKQHMNLSSLVHVESAYVGCVTILSF